MKRTSRKLPWAVLASILLSTGIATAEWAEWRGPHRTGVSDETGLVEDWSQEGSNLLWHQPFIGRSTPVVVDGRACVIGRVGTRVDRQERVACYDVATGQERWQHRFNVYHTTVPFNRVGWASLAADPETGNVYAHGVGGQLYAYAPDGKVLWWTHLTERFGHLSGYGGRTQTPLVHGDLLILTFVSAGWGEHGPPRHRTFAFDKYDGSLLWVATPGRMPKDMNTQSVPVVAEIEGRTLLVGGGADGWIYALDPRDGSKIWEFQLSKRGLNSSVVVAGDRVFAAHSEENFDSPKMGRVVAIDGKGSGDITKSNEVWRVDLSVGFGSPALHEGRLYLLDNSANLHALAADTGAELWSHNVGTVGKSSPVIADGKIFVTEVNGRIHILKPSAESCETLDSEEISMPGEDRYAEIYGSPAVAYGRVFFSTEAGLYAVGTKGAEVAMAPRPERSAPEEASRGPLLVLPPDAMVAPGGTAQLGVATIDRRGRISRPESASWSAQGENLSVDASGTLSAAPGGARVGAVTASWQGMQAQGRLRVIPQLPIDEGFETLADGKPPATWIGAGGKFVGGEFEGRRVLVQPPRPRGLQRSLTYFGWSDWNNFTIEAEVRGSRTKRRLPDIGLIGGGYILDLQGNDQELEIRSWTSVLRMASDVEYSWETDVWYHLKMKVEVNEDRAVIRGKVWKVGDEEPAEWTVTAEDPLPIEAGCAGIVGYAPAEIYYDNLKVGVN